MQREHAMPPIHPGVRIGHVHLKVADLERALRVLLRRARLRADAAFGPGAAFVSAGGYHHHIGLNTWESKGGSAPPPGTTGLYHVAILYPTRAALADALRRLVAAEVPLDGASDHGVSEALYLQRPRRQRGRALLGPARGAVAALRRRGHCHVHAAAGSRRPPFRGRCLTRSTLPGRTSGPARTGRRSGAPPRRPRHAGPTGAWRRATPPRSARG